MKAASPCHMSHARSSFSLNEAVVEACLQQQPQSVMHDNQPMRTFVCALCITSNAQICIDTLALLLQEDRQVFCIGDKLMIKHKIWTAQVEQQWHFKLQNQHITIIEKNYVESLGLKTKELHKPNWLQTDSKSFNWPNITIKQFLTNFKYSLCHWLLF